MKIITIARTRNEALNIERFCESYTWVYKILVADGGSEDDTIELAKQYRNVEVREFTERVEREGEWRNPHGKHINYMIEWAELYSPDWIIFDDVDCVPNYAIKRDWKFIFETANDHNVDFILANRVYIYKDKKYFKKLTCPTNSSDVVYESKYIPSLWAWRGGTDFRAKEDDPYKHEFNMIPTLNPRKDLLPPYCLLHYFYPNDKYMKRKVTFYNKVYDYGDAKIRDPKEFGGSLLPLEEWMHQ